jgi:uncharacterized membrane protein YdjX (TVP38/TMEM64 family)
MNQENFSQQLTFRFRHHRAYLTLCLVGVALLLITVALLAYFVEDYTTVLEAGIRNLGDWAPFCFILGAALLCVCFVPQGVLSIAGGVLFGLGPGLLFVFLSECVSAFLSFFIGRHFLRKKVMKWIEKHPRLGMFDRASPDKRLRLMFLMRLAPANFSLLNYVCAVSNVRLWRYSLALIGVLPGNLCTVYAGDVARHVSRLAGGNEHEGTMHYILMIGGLFIAILSLSLIARVAYRMVKEDVSPSLESTMDN